MMVLYPLLRRFVSSIRIFYISLAMSMLGYIILFAIASLGQNHLALLLIPGVLIMAASGMNNVLTTIFLANTVDYGQLIRGRRDESVIFSMQTFVVKLASGLAALVASLALQAFRLSSAATRSTDQNVDFSAGVSMASKMGLRMVMTLIPIAGLMIAFFWFRKKYVLTDARLEEISEQLREKERS